jgi:glycosyltransferase involved in cell wall biosynthesis
MDRPQKNLHTLIRAFDQIKDRFPDYLLVMVGQLRRLRPDRHEKSADIARDMPSTEDLVTSLGLTDRVVITGFVSDAQLGGLYRGASAFVLPSLFEGFGMPAAEALALRTPTLVSDLPVLREVTLGGAQYLANPQSQDELAERVAGILKDVEAARPLPELAEKIRRHYAPPTIARQYYDLWSAKRRLLRCGRQSGGAVCEPGRTIIAASRPCWPIRFPRAARTWCSRSSTACRTRRTMARFWRR